MNSNITGRFPCECYTHEMSIHSDDEAKCLEFGYWQRGKSEQPWKFKTRIKMIFDIISTGNPYADMLILNRDSVEKLRDKLNEFLENTK